MNKTYKVVWSHAKNAFVVASELAVSKGKSKKKGSGVVAGAVGGAALVIGAAAMPFGNTAYACSASPCDGPGAVYDASVSGVIPGGPGFSFTNGAVLNADVANTLSNIDQMVNLSDSLADLSVQDALTGGYIGANGTSEIHVNAAGAVSGGTVHLNGQSVMHVNTTGGVSGGTQQVGAGATLMLNAASAITGGEQIVLGTMELRAQDAISGASQQVIGGTLLAAVEKSISDSTIAVSKAGALELGADDALDKSVVVTLNADDEEGGGVFKLNGHNVTIGGLSGNSGRVENNPAINRDVTLAIDVAAGDTYNFGGLIEDKTESSLVKLVKLGEGTQVLSGVAGGASGSYHGGTEVLGGTLEGTTESLVGDIENNSNLVFNQNHSGSFRGELSGSGTVTIAGGGVVSLAGGDNTHARTVVNNAQVSVVSDTNLGAAGGLLTLNDGALAVLDNETAGVTSIDRDISINGVGGILAQDDVEFNGNISGAGNLRIHAEHSGSPLTVYLKGNNSYTNTIVDSGIVIGNAQSIKGSVQNSGTVVFDQAVDGEVTGGMVGAGKFVKEGVGNLRISGGSLSDWDINEGRLTASARQFLGDAHIASAGTLAFDESLDIGYTGQITGDGNFIKQGDGSLTLYGDSSTFAGLTTVEAGKLVVNTEGTGKLGGSMMVLNSGVLKGSGTVGSTILAAGGVVAPGNSIGTLTIDGDLTFDSASTYEVEVDPAGTSSDLIKVTGTAHLAGQVAHVGFNGAYAPNSQYTILEAGAIDGEFDSVTSIYAFLDPVLTQDATTVNMELKRNDTPIGGGADSGNGGSAGDGVGSVGGEGDGAGGTGGSDGGGEIGNGSGVGTGPESALNPTIYDKVIVLPKTEVANALELLSGEIHASTSSALINSSRLARDTSIKHLRNHFDAAPLGKVRNDVASWVEVVGQRTELDGDSNASSLDYRLGGVFMGAHAHVGGGWRLGGSFGYTDGDVEIDAKASKADIETYSASLFGGNSLDMGKGKLNVLAGLSYSWHDINTSRSVMFPGLNERLKADYEAQTGQLFAEVGYAMPVSNLTIVEPYAGVAVTRHKTDSFSESGGLAALSGESKTNTVTSTTLGLRAKTAFSLGKTQGILSGALGWRHASGDVNPEATLSFAGGNPFTVTGAPISKNAAVVEVGAHVGLSKNTSLGLSYSGQYGSGNHESAGSLNLRVRF